MHTKQSLLEAQQIRDQSKSEMQTFQNANNKEVDDLAMQIKQMEALITQSEVQQKQVEIENVKLQQGIEQGRKMPVKQNKAVLDSILSKDREFDGLYSQTQKITKQRFLHLQEFNRECESQSKKTKESEVMLKDKETLRYSVQCEKEALEKTLVELNEKNMSEQSLNYKFKHRSSYLVKRSNKQESRIKMLQEKIKFLTDNINKSVRDQQEKANEVDVEYKRIQMELTRV